MNSSIIQMPLCRLVVNFIQQSHSHFHSVGVNEVSLTSNHEWTCRKKLSCWSWFGYLLRVNPPSAGNNLCLPGFWSTHCEYGCLFQSVQRYSDIFSMTFYDSWGGSSVVWMHVQISCFHISFDDKFILVWISSWNDQISFWTDEPVKLFEPKYLPLWQVFAKNFILLFLNFFECLLFSKFENLFTGLFGSLLLLIVFLLAFVVHRRIGIGVIIDVDLNR